MAPSWLSVNATCPSLGTGFSGGGLDKVRRPIARNFHFTMGAQVGATLWRFNSSDFGKSQFLSKFVSLPSISSSPLLYHPPPFAPSSFGTLLIGTLLLSHPPSFPPNYSSSHSSPQILYSLTHVLFTIRQSPSPPQYSHTLIPSQPHPYAPRISTPSSPHSPSPVLLASPPLYPLTAHTSIIITPSPIS